MSGKLHNSGVAVPLAEDKNVDMIAASCHFIG
jgi:hypothetical protein